MSLNLLYYCYYRRFIKIISDYSRQLTKLCKKNVAFEWIPECNQAFDNVKNDLATPTPSTLVQYPDFKKQFCVSRDTSKYAVVRTTIGSKLPVSYVSRTFAKSETKKSTIFCALLEVIDASAKSPEFSGLSQFFRICYGNFLSFILAINHYNKWNWYSGLRLSENMCTVAHTFSSVKKRVIMPAKCIAYLFRSLHAKGVKGRKCDYITQFRVESALMHDFFIFEQKRDFIMQYNRPNISGQHFHRHFRSPTFSSPIFYAESKFKIYSIKIRLGRIWFHSRIYQREI